jgi:hypothetical protein
MWLHRGAADDCWCRGMPVVLVVPRAIVVAGLPAMWILAPTISTLPTRIAAGDGVVAGGCELLTAGCAADAFCRGHKAISRNVSAASSVTDPPARLFQSLDLLAQLAALLKVLGRGLGRRSIDAGRQSFTLGSRPSRLRRSVVVRSVPSCLPITVVTVRRDRFISAAIQREDFPALWCLMTCRVHHSDVAVEGVHKLVVGDKIGIVD